MSWVLFLGMSHEFEGNYQRLLIEAKNINQKTWCSGEELCTKEGRPMGNLFLAKSLSLSQVKIVSFEKFVPNQLIYLELQRSEYFDNQLRKMGVEFSFARSSVAPFMKISIAGESDLLFKFAKGESERSGGLFVLPNQEFVEPEKSWLRTINIGKDARFFSFVFGDNPVSGKGSDSFYIGYEKRFNKTIGKAL